METSGLKKFAAQARTDLIAQVGSRLDYVLESDAVELRDRLSDIEKIKSEIAKTSREALIERVAYLWFNRMSALRYMDANSYTDIGIVSPAPNQSQPEILAEAKTGSIDPGFASDSNKAKILSLLSGQTSAADPEGAAYRLLFLGACNHYGQTMSFMFEAIADWTELLLPADLLSESSTLSQIREVMTIELCQDVEVIGWLYQFYIADKKSEVIGRPKGTKITPENIPAATQLFTPHWIVRYLVENSIGRLWMLNNPDSRLIRQMDYYVEPEESEERFLRISSPEEIKICDPACGSGHMLTYAFDLLYVIYEECGYDPYDIPAHILNNNLFGIEIDERAGALSAFALTMKARSKQRQFLNSGVQPNICIMENVKLDEFELDEFINKVGRDLFTKKLRKTLTQFETAKNFGSLIIPEGQEISEVARVIETYQFDDNLFLHDVKSRVKTILRMTEYLSPKYHVIVANPPYMGGKGMNSELGGWLKSNYPLASSDLMTAFMVRISSLVPPGGLASIVTLDAWMFLTTYKKLRASFAANHSYDSLVHIGWNAFPDGHVYNRGVAFVVRMGIPNQKGTYVNLANLPAVANKDIEFQSALQTKVGIHKLSSSEFKSIPGYPIAYWVSEKVRTLFSANDSIGDKIEAKQGLATADNNRFLRFWWEPELKCEVFDSTSNGDSRDKDVTWVSYNKGGKFRRWYGNHEYVVNWKNSGKELYDFRPKSVVRNPDFYFKSSVSWSDVTSGGTAFRYYPSGFVFDSTGHSAFPNKTYEWEELLCFANTKICQELFDIVNPTIHHHVGYFKSLPALSVNIEHSKRTAKRAVEISRCDWDAYETSWNFTTLPLISLGNKTNKIEDSYISVRSDWRDMTDEMHSLEEDNNRIFIDGYGLNDELTFEVPVNEITLTCNPANRFGGKNTDEELEQKLRAETMLEFLHYSVGCMFGRYSLDEQGLILANQGESIEEYLQRIPNPTFTPDDDNIIPILNGNWFSDDIVERFKVFLRTTFGVENYADNLEYIEASIGKKIRPWFLKEFYSYHWKRYQKRPIYWMISSPKGSFNVLFYMHRYRPELFSQVLEDYLRPFQSKLEGHLGDLNRTMNDSSASARDIKTATKEIDNIRAIQRELQDWERDVLYPLAGKRIKLDLDNGVKINYPQFAPALKKIPGL